MKVLAAVSLFLMASATYAQTQSQPQPAAPTPAIAPPQDIPYPGLIRLSVDATDLAHAIFKVRETIPVAGPGPLTLLYPKWLPGYHAPQAEIALRAHCHLARSASIRP